MPPWVKQGTAHRIMGHRSDRDPARGNHAFGLSLLLLLVCADATLSGVTPMVDVFYPGLMPKEHAMGMEWHIRARVQAVRQWSGPTLAHSPDHTAPRLAGASERREQACYAIPALLFVPTPEPVLLAVVEAKQGRVCGDGVNSTLLMRRSTDYGATWGTPFFPYRTWAPNRKWGQPQMVYDAVTETALILFSNETLSGSPGGVQTLTSVLQMGSTDGGRTWSEAVQVDGPGPTTPLGWAPTSGSGIQLRDGSGPHSGRLLFSMDTLAYGHGQVLLSDSHGQSYNRSLSLNTQPADAGNEFQLTQLPNGSVLAVIRNTLMGRRMEVSMSTDGGDTFGPLQPHPDLWSPVCQASVLSPPPGVRTVPPAGIVLFAGPRSTTARINMTVLSSADDGATFTHGLPIWPDKEGGYSCMAWLGAGTAGSAGMHREVALLFNRDGGNISVVRFDVADVKTPIPPSPPPPPPPTPPPPPVVNSTCAIKLAAYCTAQIDSGACIPNANASCPGWAPAFGVWAGECGLIVRGPHCADSCASGVAPKPPTWRCFSHLALDANHSWSPQSARPVLGCTDETGLQQVYDACMGIRPGPPSPPPPPPPPPPTPTGLHLANVLGSGMVLQRSPAASRIWGRAVPGDVVAVKIGVAGGVAVAVGNGTAEAGTGNWAVRLPPIAAGGPYSVVIRSTRPTDAIITLTDVLVGEVHVCSGQSNMDFTLAGVFNASAECAAAEYPSLRLFKPQRLASAFPLFDLSGSAVLNWTHATPNTTCGAAWQTTLDRSTGFSATCYFYAQELHQSLGGIPIGVIDTAWGGTPIEVWMSAQAMAACPNHTSPGLTTANTEGDHPWSETASSFPSESSSLFNAMIAPFTPMVTAGFLWWQGESNARTAENAIEYSCNQKAFITDLRIKFDATPQLPFVFVQSFPLYGNLSQFQPYPGGGGDTLEGLSELRLSQADSLELTNVGMACTIDLGDVGCPFTWQHNRAKRQCTHRAALIARAVIYGEQSLVHRGPEPHSATWIRIPHVRGPYFEIDINFTLFGSAGLFRAPVPVSILSFEVLLSAPSHGPRDGRDADAAAGAEYWVPATVHPAEQCIDAGEATIKIGVTSFFDDAAIPLTVRYAHGAFPTGVVHNLEGLPVAPFILVAIRNTSNQSS